MPKQQRPAKPPLASPGAAAPQKHYPRFSALDRLEHGLFILIFTLLAVTGLPQKFSTAPLSQTLIAAFGGIDQIRQVHHWAAIAVMAEAILHIITVGYRAIVLRRPLAILPVGEDFRHFGQNLAYMFGRRKERPRFGRYTYEEKTEYLAVIWGMLIMIVTGFFMWNPIATTQALPGEVIPAAKVAHGAEAVLAVLAIVGWHFYNNHFKRFNKSMYTGQISEAEMLHEHPEELAQIKAGTWQPPERRQLQQRQSIFFPVAAVLAVVLTVGLYRFVTFEQTAITTLLPRPTGEAFSPQTPTPTPQPSPTPVPAAELTWDRLVGPLLAQKCGECHGEDGGLSLTSHPGALAGGASGPAILPGDADGSLLVIYEARGDHPGQLSGQELALVKEWIQAGAPKN